MNHHVLFLVHNDMAAFTFQHELSNKMLNGKAEKKQKKNDGTHAADFVLLIIKYTQKILYRIFEYAGEMVFPTNTNNLDEIFRRICEFSIIHHTIEERKGIVKS
jgi:hypothetical protein